MNNNFTGFSDLDGLEFFRDFAKKTIDSNLIGINNYLQAISTYHANAASPTATDGYTKAENIEEKYNDIKKSTYYNIKSMHDTLSSMSSSKGSVPDYAVSTLAGLSKMKIDPEMFKLFSKSDTNCDTNDKPVYYDLYQIFQVVDRGNNDIGTKVLANLAYLYDNLYVDFSAKSITPGVENQESQLGNLTKTSVNAVFSELAKQSGFWYQQIPNYLNLNSAISNLQQDQIPEVVDHMFGTHTDTDLFGDTFLNKRNIRFGGPSGLPGIIFQLGSIDSKLDTNLDTKQVKNNYSNSFCLDIGYDNNQNISLMGEDAPKEILDSNVTAFVVDFGKQNQQMFKSINLDTSQFYSTEESIRSWVDLVNKSGTMVQSTNLFPVFEKRSYTCSVKSLGNATIQPLTYFYLRNVPLFHGTYWITNVVHRISPNTMETEFKGVRQSIATKSDTRKALLRLLKDKTDLLRKANDAANNIVTEGVKSTQGIIKYDPASDKPYGDFLQQVSEGNGGYMGFDGKTILGAYIYSVTQDNTLSAKNLGVIATLYNIASVFGASKVPSEVVKSMPYIAIGLMKKQAANGDTRYILDTGKELSLSSLIKGSGNNFRFNGLLGEYLDKIVTDGLANNKLPSNSKPYDVKATLTGDKPITNTHDQVTIASVSPINTQVTSDKIDLSKVNLFLEPNGTIYYGNDTFPATGNNTLYDLFNSASTNADKIVNDFNEKNIKGVDSDKVAKLYNKRPEKNVELAKKWKSIILYEREGIINIALQKFALAVSDGTYTLERFKEYFIVSTVGTKFQIDSVFETDIKKLLTPLLDNFGNILPSVFYATNETVRPEIFNSIIDPSGSNDLQFTVNGKIHSYDLQGMVSANDTNFNNLFIQDYGVILDKLIEDYDNSVKTTAPKPSDNFSVKYLGAYGTEGTSNVAFFTTNIDGSWGNVRLNKADFDLSAKSATDDVTTTNITGTGAIYNGSLDFYNNAAKLIAAFEGFGEKAKWDVNAYRLGHGSDTITLPDGTFRKVVQGDITTRELAAKDLARRIKDNFSPKVEKQIGQPYYNNLPDQAKIALISLSYNYGSITHQEIIDAARTGDVNKIATAIVDSTKNDNLGKDYYTALRNRRQKEANYAKSGLNRTTSTNDPATTNATTNSAAATTNATSSSVAIGDSIASGVIGAYNNIKGITSPQILNKGGKHLTLDAADQYGGNSLLTLLRSTTTTYPNVKNLVLSIGANDLWSLTANNANELECIGLIKKIFPNATYYILNGNYGWKGLSVQGTKTDIYWQDKINNYINVYKNANFIVVGNVSLCLAHPSKNDILYNSFDPILSKLT